MAGDDIYPTNVVSGCFYKPKDSVRDNAGLPLRFSSSLLYHPKGRKLDTPELAFIEPAHDGKKTQAVLVKNGVTGREIHSVELSEKAMWKMFMQLAIELRNARK